MNELQHLKVLLVDDETDILDFLEVYLKRYGAIVFRATNGIDAFEIATREKPDVVLTDVMMPGENADGITLTRKLRSQHPTPPLVIVITGFSRETEAKALEAGADRVIGKPFALEQLKEYLRTIPGRTKV